MKLDDPIYQIARTTVSDVFIRDKIGRGVLQPKICEALRRAGYVVAPEDSDHFLKRGMPVWRNKKDQQIEVTKGRRAIDLVVYLNEEVVALIETESDLDNLREHGFSGKGDGYDVYSIARNEDGSFFHSYKSLERMAAAAYYHHLSKTQQTRDPVQVLEGLMSESPTVHNPEELPLLLISGQCRSRDRRILSPRLKSLGARLICGKMK